jgi:hypothetical protein
VTQETNWLDRLERLHPLLGRRRAGSAWTVRQAEIDAARRIDQDAARRSREAAARQVEREYDNTPATWAAVAIVIIVAVLGLWLVFRLIEESRLEDCILAHRHTCDQLLP